MTNGFVGPDGRSRIDCSIKILRIQQEQPKLPKVKLFLSFLTRRAVYKLLFDAEHLQIHHASS